MHLFSNLCIFPQNLFRVSRKHNQPHSQALAAKMAKVKAMYNYSYDYEGTKITFKKGEEFQLLTKANADWWQVRRWKEGSAQDIYVPAVYVQEVSSSSSSSSSSTAEKEPKSKDPPNPTYENIADLKKKLRNLQTRENGDSKPPAANSTEVSSQPPSVLAKPSGRRDSNEKFKPKSEPPKSSPTHNPLKAKKSTDSLTKAAPNGVQVAPRDPKVPQVLDNEYAKPVSPSVLCKFNKGGQNSPAQSSSFTPQKANTAPSTNIKDNWLPGYALPERKLAKPRSQSVNTGRNTPNDPSSPTEEKTFDAGARPTSPTGAKGGGRTKVPPPVLPKVKAKPLRPKSMVVSPTEESFDAGNGTNGSADLAFPKPSEVKRSTNSLPMGAQPIGPKKIAPGEILSKSLDFRKTASASTSEKPPTKVSGRCCLVARQLGRPTIDSYAVAGL